MGIWKDLATWRGPTKSEGDGDGVSEPGDRLTEHRGVVVHIAAGYFEGTISWQRNPSARVSSHFVVAKDGRIAQMVDTDIRAWTQRDGNSRWLSIENEGFLPDALTPAQVEANAKILARAHREHGIPLQVATSPNGRGLGHHSMGAENGVDWGHSECPGKAIVAQKPAIVARAQQIAAGHTAPQKENDMPLTDDELGRIAHKVAGFQWPPANSVDPKPGMAFYSNARDAAAAATQAAAGIGVVLAELRAIAGKDWVDEAAIVDGILTGLAGRSIDDAADALAAAFGDRVGDLAAALVSRVPAES